MILAAVAALAPAPAPAIAIAPPLDRPLRLVSEELRDDGRSVRRYRLERTLLFAAEPGGFRAIVTLDRATAGGDDSRRRQFVAANAPLRGRPVVIHLAPDGSLRSVDDVAAVWSAWRAGLTGALEPRSARGADAAPLGLAMDRLPLARKAALIAAPILSLIARPEDRLPRPEQPTRVTMGARTFDGVSDAVRDGTMVMTRLRTASSDGRATVTVERRVDPAFGLILNTRRIEESIAPNGGLLRAEVASNLAVR